MIKPRQAVDALSIYAPPLEGRRTRVRLDFNENTVGFPWAHEGIEPDWITAYPEYQELQAKLAVALGVSPDGLMLTNGSDEALFVIASTFIEPKQDRAIVSRPTFAMIVHYLKLAEAQLVEIPMQPDLTFDLAATERALEAGAKLIIIASPDNPTGATLPLDVLERWCERFTQTLFVMDEAYSEYSGQSALPLLARFSNLMVTRTFSKAWGLAGLRLGLIFAHPQLIDYMMRVRSPYSVNTIAVRTALTLLDRAEDVRTQVAHTLQRKQWVLEAVQAKGFSIVSGPSNFFLIGAGPDSKALCSLLESQNILIRDRSTMPLLDGYARVSVGTDAEMEWFLHGLDLFRQTHALIFDMDDTLVDTSKSFDVTVQTLVERYSAQPLTRDELHALRAEGGFNDDWDATVELLKRRGVAFTYEQAQTEGKTVYHSLARENERLLVDLDILKALGKRYRLFVVTGRYRDEYEPVWGDTFSPLFEAVICRDDYANTQPKPAPDTLLPIRHSFGIEHGWYIGNSVDDVKAALAADFMPIGVTITQPEERLRQSGAAIIVESVNGLGALFRL